MELKHGRNMDSHSQYVLISDNCDNCKYVVNAFTLLKLPLREFSLENLQESPQLIANTSAVIICPQLEESQAKKISVLFTKENIHAISFLDTITHKKAIKPLHYLKMPFTQFELIHTLSLCQHTRETTEFTHSDHPMFERLIGPSHAIRQIRHTIHQVADSDTTVLILGQSGTGKDVIASCIHYLSNRKDKPFVPINCGAIPSELMESELFGHEKGAFTGAVTRRPGRFEMANTGTLFLDEIGDMPLPMQVKLLRVIQERTLERVGSNTSIKVDVRLIAATNQNLEELIKQHQFREDLFYRLNVFPIKVPNLHERSEDIPFLIDYHLAKISDRLKHSVIFTERAKEILSAYAWPGNIRELENFLERMVILHRDQVLDEKDLDPLYKQKTLQNKPKITTHIHSDEPFNIKEYIANVESQMIQFALERSNGMIQSAADYLSLGKAALLEKMKKYNLINE